MSASLRTILVVAAYALVVLGYWATGQRAAELGATMSPTDLDRAVPLVPALVVPYLSYFPFLLWVFLRLARKPCFWRDLAPILAVVAFSIAIFLVWPTRIVRAPCDDANWASRLLAVVQRIDAPGNCVPSLHASLTVLACLLAVRHRFLTSVKAFGIGLCIVASTVLVKQHLCVDAAAGVLLAALVWRADTVCARLSGRVDVCAKECVT